MKKILGCFLLFIMLAAFTACDETSKQSVKTDSTERTQTANIKMYDGRALTIGIIGNKPHIREKNVQFKNISFSDLEKESQNSFYDAIFITKDNLSEAAQGKYAGIYKKSKIPFFFIQTKKTYVPFIVEDLSYEDAADVNDQNYATGILFSDNGNFLSSWGYSLYNDIENEQNVKEVYSRIFQTISEVTVSK